MKLAWNKNKCIVCLRARPLTEEHVIPRSLGGKLTCDFLCKECNESFGNGFEADARLAPELRIAAQKQDPHLYGDMERGAIYLADFDGQQLEMKIRNGHLVGGELGDGSLIIPDTEMPSALVKHLKRHEGLNSDQIEQAVELYVSADPRRIVQIAPGTCVRKWVDHPARPIFTEKPLSILAPLKIAYEFIALILGGAVAQKHPALDLVRHALKDQDEEFALGRVSERRAQNPVPIHGIAFEGNLPHARLQIRLFGSVAYFVEFVGLGINFCPITYTHELKTGLESVVAVEK